MKHFVVVTIVATILIFSGIAMVAMAGEFKENPIILAQQGQVPCHGGYCPTGHPCCTKEGKGWCCPAGAFCCNNDHGCCWPGDQCCSGGGCCATGEQCCIGGGCCKAGTHCCTEKGETKCCNNEVPSKEGECTTLGVRDCRHIILPGGTPGADCYWYECTQTGSIRQMIFTGIKCNCP